MITFKDLTQKIKEDIAVIVIGDTILDVTFFSEDIKECVEGIPYSYKVDRDRYKYSVGGAGNAAEIAAYLSDDVHILTALPRDLFGNKAEFSPRINAHLMPFNARDYCNVKYRVLDKDGLLQFRFEHDGHLKESEREFLKETLVGKVESVVRMLIRKDKKPIILISDYCKGFLGYGKAIKQIISYCRQENICCFVDTNRDMFIDEYEGATAIKINCPTLEKIKATYHPNVLRLETPVVLTCGKLGASYGTLTGEGHHCIEMFSVPEIKWFYRQKEIDAIGAGDVFFVFFSLFEATGQLPVSHSIPLGCIAAAISTKYPCTYRPVIEHDFTSIWEKTIEEIIK